MKDPIPLKESGNAFVAGSLSAAVEGAIWHLHEEFISAVTSSLTVALRTSVTGRLISVEQMAYSTLAGALPNPACFIYLSMEPFVGHALLEVSPVLVAPVLDLVMGGSGKVQSEPGRHLTEVEKLLLEEFFQTLTNDLREAWKPFGALRFANSVIETSPQLSARFVPSEAVVAIAAELEIGGNTGRVTLAIPSIALKAISPRFEQQRTPGPSEDPAIARAIERKLARQLEVVLECEYAHATIGMKSLLGLAVGDIFTLGSSFDETVDVLVNGSPMFRGALGTSPKNCRMVVLE